MWTCSTCKPKKTTNSAIFSFEKWFSAAKKIGKNYKLGILFLWELYEVVIAPSETLLSELSKEVMKSWFIFIFLYSQKCINFSSQIQCNFDMKIRLKNHYKKSSAAKKISETSNWTAILLWRNLLSLFLDSESYMTTFNS